MSLLSFLSKYPPYPRGRHNFGAALAKPLSFLILPDGLVGRTVAYFEQRETVRIVKRH